MVTKELVWLSKCLNECRLGEFTRVSSSEFQALILLGTNEMSDNSSWCGGQMGSVMSSLLPVC